VDCGKGRSEGRAMHDHAGCFCIHGRGEGLDGQDAQSWVVVRRSRCMYMGMRDWARYESDIVYGKCGQ
jgi:hypothetical protein